MANSYWNTAFYGGIVERITLQTTRLIFSKILTKYTLFLGWEWEIVESPIYEQFPIILSMMYCAVHIIVKSWLSAGTGKWYRNKQVGDRLTGASDVIFERHCESQTRIKVNEINVYLLCMLRCPLKFHTNPYTITYAFYKVLKSLTNYDISELWHLMY